jgi:hypothetical protein
MVISHSCLLGFQARPIGYLPAGVSEPDFRNGLRSGDEIAEKIRGMIDALMGY